VSCFIREDFILEPALVLLGMKKPRPGTPLVVRTKLDNSIEIIWKDKSLLVKEATTLFNEYK
jgi:hypothetical protein